MLKNKAGYTLIEMFLVLMILLVFSITAFALIFFGSDTYNRLIVDKNNAADARIVLSTFDMRLRQYDYAGGSALTQVKWQNETVPALCLNEWAEDGSPVNTWLIWHDGTLWEALTTNNAPPTPETSQELLTNRDLALELSANGSLIDIKVTYTFSGQSRELENKIYRRSAN